MGYLDDPLWQALGEMRIEPDGAALSFTRRLARDNGWSIRFATEVMTEYRRFLYLAATGTHAVTPSEHVDQAWHLHLAYTRHYWGELCGRIIGRPLHHGPTAGGRAENARYRRLYAETLARYGQTFGQEPPVAIWPASDVRFGGSYQWVDRTRNLVIPRRTVTAGGAAVAAVALAACTAMAAEGRLPNGGSALDGFIALMLASDLAFFIAVVGVFMAVVLVVRIVRQLAGRRARASQNAMRRRRRPGDDSGSGGGDSGYDDWSTTGSGVAAAGGAAFVAGGGDFGGAGAEGGWDSSDSGSGSSDSGGDSSGCGGGGCGGGGD